VVRKNGDVLGNTVNIASRLESSAKEGSVYISRQVNDEVKQYIHSREIGPVKVKGIEKPVFVFEPFEISLDLPENLRFLLICRKNWTLQGGREILPRKRRFPLIRETKKVHPKRAQAQTMIKISSIEKQHSFSNRHFPT